MSAHAGEDGPSTCPPRPGAVAAGCDRPTCRTSSATRSSVGARLILASRPSTRTPHQECEPALARAGPDHGAAPRARPTRSEARRRCGIRCGARAAGTVRTHRDHPRSPGPSRPADRRGRWCSPRAAAASAAARPAELPAGTGPGHSRPAHASGGLDPGSSVRTTGAWLPPETSIVRQQLDRRRSVDIVNTISLNGEIDSPYRTTGREIMAKTINIRYCTS